jgi:hypothetical protein
MEIVQRVWEEWTPVRILSGFLLWSTLLGVLSFFLLDPVYFRSLGWLELGKGNDLYIF